MTNIQKADCDLFPIVAIFLINNINSEKHCNKTDSKLGATITANTAILAFTVQQPLLDNCSYCLTM